MRTSNIRIAWIVMQNEWISSVTTPVFWYATCLIPFIILVIYIVVIWLIGENPKESWLEDENVKRWEFIIESQLEEQDVRPTKVQHYAVLDLSEVTVENIRTEIARNDRYLFLVAVLAMDDTEFNHFFQTLAEESGDDVPVQLGRILRSIRQLDLDLPKARLLDQLLQDVPIPSDVSSTELSSLKAQFPRFWEQHRSSIPSSISTLSRNFFTEVVAADNSERAVRSLLANNEIVGYFVIPKNIGESNADISFVTLTEVSREDFLVLVNWYRSLVSTVIRKQRFVNADIDPVLQYQLLYQIPEVTSDLSVDTSENFEIPEQFHLFIFIGLSITLFLLMMGSTARVISNVFDEKSSKLADNLLASMSVLHLLDGKLWGTALTSLTVMLVWAFLIPLIVFGLGVSELKFLTSVVDVIAQPIIVMNFILFLILVYAFYGYFLVAFTSMFSTLNNAISAFMLFTFGLTILLIPAVVVPLIPITLVQDVISFFPPSTPFVMVARSGSLPTWPVYLAIVGVMLLSVIGVRSLSGRLFARGISDETRIALFRQKSSLP